jgi:hypothetical protein
MLQYCNDVSAADWIVQAQIPCEQLVNFGPPGFPAYARLRFIPDPTKPGQTEADAYVADNHLSEMQQTRLALEHLRDASPPHPRTATSASGRAMATSTFHPQC